MRKMDLHDYEDVAENYDNYLDVMSSGYENFQEFYLELAREYGNEGCIDIACGTGAVLLYLAEKGIDIDGTDLSEAMVNITRKKAEKMGLKLNIFTANMTEFRSERKYSMAIIARSGFMHLTSPELQRQALVNIRENLLSGGILTLNTFAPSPKYQVEQMKTSPDDYSYRLEYTNKDGQRERIYNAIMYDPTTQIMSGNWRFDTLNDEGNVISSRIRPLAMRQTYKQEMLYLIELSGFDVVAVYDDYKKTPATNRNFIWVLRKNK